MKVGVVGDGRLGSALRRGWARVDDLTVVSLSRNDRWDHAAGKLDIVVLAVKPKDVATAAAMHRDLLMAHPVVSCAAGVRLAVLARHLGRVDGVARAMPNICAAVQASSTTLCLDDGDAALRATLGQLFGYLGDVHWVPRGEEPTMDAVTAVAGSGPAYIYEVMAALAEAGQALGLDAATSRRLAAETTRGAALMLLAHPTETVERLVGQVASPGGTTEAALHLLRQEGLGPLMGRAITAAAHRARGLDEASAGARRETP